VIISILDFNLFECAEFHSEFRPLEATRHEPLSDRMSLHFFELRKVPAQKGPMDMLLLWLSLFRARTDEDLDKIKALGVPEMERAIDAFNQITASPEFLEIERQLEKARLTEASALRRSATRAAERERMKWQTVVAGKDAEIAGKNAENERLRAEIEKLRTGLKD